MKKKLLNVILSISLLFTMISINSIDVFADGHSSHDGVGSWNEVTTDLPSTEGNYYLANDITLSGTWSVPAGTTNLCLNGHVINANGGSFRVITIPTGATLNLYDCNSTTSHEGYVDSNSLWHLGTGGGTSKTITGGIVTGGLRGGLSVSGTFNMYGGSIAGNNAGNSGDHGGGMYIAGSGQVNIINGVIENNNCNQAGAAAQVDGTFIMSGGIIQNNRASGDGGGVSLNGNSATVTIKGTAKIINNIAHGNGGGVSYYNADNKLTIGNNVQIFGNTGADGNTTNNVYLFGTNHILLGDGADAPANGMKVGVKTASSVGIGTPVTFVASCSENNANYFFSDNIEQGVNFSSNHLELFKPSNNVHNKTQDAWYLTLAEAIAAASSGDVIKLWQNDNAENVVLPDGVTLYTKLSHTGNITTISGKVIVKQDATGDFRYKYSVADAPVVDNPTSNSDHIVLDTGVRNVSTNN